MIGSQQTKIVGFTVVALLCCGIAAWHFESAHSNNREAHLILETLSDVPHRAADVVTAIKSFELDHRMPPRTLEDLVPRYMKRIPVTGIDGHERYEYTVYPYGGIDPFVWYKIGERSENLLAAGQYEATGTLEQAILVIEHDDTGRVWRAIPVRHSYEGEDVDFDADEWLNSPTRRPAMTSSVVRRLQQRGTTLGDVTKILGEPDGVGVKWQTDWELAMTLPDSNWMLHHVRYWPSERYPQGAHRVGTNLNWEYWVEEF